MASATIVIPCYNEEKRLDISSFSTFRSASHRIRFLFVDDGSTDGTLQLLETMNRADRTTFKVLRVLRNRGKGEAVRQGMLSAMDSHPDYIGFWDADLATPLRAIDEFVDIAESRPGLEVIVGSRVKLLGRTIQRHAARHYLGRLFATGVSIVLGLAVYDTQCGAKLFKISPTFRTIFDQPFLSRWIFDVEILARVVQARDNDLCQLEKVIYEFPLSEWRDVAGSKLRYVDFLRAPWELYQIYKHYFRCRTAGSLHML